MLDNKNRSSGGRVTCRAPWSPALNPADAMIGLDPTDATSLTVGFLVPISSEFQILTAGAKQRLWQSADGLTAAALTAKVTKPFGELGDDMSYILNSNLVVGKRTGNGYGFHAALGYLGARTIDSVFWPLLVVSYRY